jgi:hypothetical protein
MTFEKKQAGAGKPFARS